MGRAHTFFGLSPLVVAEDGDGVDGGAPRAQGEDVLLRRERHADPEGEDGRRSAGELAQDVDVACEPVRARPRNAAGGG